MSGTILLALRFILTMSLYAFLSLALWILWKDLKSQRELLVIRQAPPILLTSQDGGLNFHFTQPEINIGRDPTCECRIEDLTVSVKHARLSYHHKQWWLEDLGSTNGTFLNQEPVSNPLVITMGDQIRCGQVVLGISIGKDGEDR